MQISPIDFAILVLYLAGITLFGARFRRGQSNLRDYFLGGRTAPWWAIACSIVATETSTLTIIGTPGIAYGGNLGFLQIVLGYLVARVILCVVLIPQYFQGEFYTAYQLLEKRFGTRMSSAAAVVFLGNARHCRGRPNLGDRESGERSVRHRRSNFNPHRRCAHDVLHVRGRHARGDLDGRNSVRTVPHGLGRGIFSVAAQNSRRLAGSDASGSRGRRQAHDFQFCFQPYAKLHVLGRTFSAEHF